MLYTIEPYRIAELVLAGDSAFEGGDHAAGYPHAMYVWIVRGGGSNVLVDTGPRSIDEINAGLSGMLIEPVTQREGEDIQSILRRAELDASEIDYVFLTHLHYDHLTNLHLFPNARIVIDRIGWEEALRRLDEGRCWVPGEVLFPMRDEWHARVLKVVDEEVLPGIRAFHVGGHTPCSLAISVATSEGTAIITGDVVSLYENIERDVPVGVYEDRQAVMAAMERIRCEADIVLPSHDPAVLERHPRVGATRS